MAIVKMKKLRVMAMADQRGPLLEALLRLGCVEVSEPEGRLADPAWAELLQRGSSRLLETRGEITDVNTTLSAINKYAHLKNGLFIRRKPISQEEFLSSSTVTEPRAICERVKGALKDISRLESREEQLRTRQAGFRPWAELDLPLDTPDTAHVLIRLGVLPGGADVGAVRTELGDLAAELLEVGRERQQRCCLLLCHRDQEAETMDILRPHGFSVVTFPETTGTARENLDRLEQEIASVRAEREAAAAAIAEAGAHRDALRAYADRLTTEAARETSAERLLTDGTIVFFEGWAPAEHMDQVEQLLTRMDCAWDARDPEKEEYPEVPIQLKNNWFTRPLNMVTEMYSLPAYDNVDPNPLMAPFFIFFYGMMMADMGYGILMVLAGLLITKKYRPKGTMGHMFSLVTLCGVSTFFWGVITGGFFGNFIPELLRLIDPSSTFEFPALFTPLDDTISVLLGSMALGFVQIVTGMAISFVRKLRRGQFLDAVFEELTWWIVFAGIGCLVLKVTNVVLYIGIAMVVIGPLIQGKGFGKLTGIFSSVYDHVTGVFGDVLSYARLMALMLAGSVIAQVFNTLGAIPGNIIVFILIAFAGNALNFALNLLGCYVHDLRLQCLEYFNKFYQDGGKPFTPLAMNTKYVDIEKV